MWMNPTVTPNNDDNWEPKNGSGLDLLIQLCIIIILFFILKYCS